MSVWLVVVVGVTTTCSEAYFIFPERTCYGLGCIPWQVHNAEILITSVWQQKLFGDRVFVEVVKLKWGE